MLIRLNATLRKVPRWVVVAGSLGYLALVAWVDYRAEFRLEMAAFYLPPIAAIAWYLGRQAGVLVALFATGIEVGLAAVLRPEWVVSQLLPWRTLTQFLLFLFAALAVSALSNQTVTLRVLAREDPLTGIPNRRAFFGALERTMEGNRRRGMSWVLAYLDVDDFKRINDTRGHGVGDAVLRRIARTLREGTRRLDVVARLGGDEFALLLPETGARDAETIINKLLAHLGSVLAHEGWDVSFSVGVITFAAPPDSVDAAMAMADALMYRVKARGKAGALFCTWPDPAALELPLGVAGATGSGLS